MTLFSEDISINTIIGAGSSIRGDIKINGFTRVDGDLDGNLETSGNVIIGENSRIRGNVVAKSVTVGGIIQGDIIAEKSVRLLSSSAVIGNIQTHNLIADEDAILNGHCIAIMEEEAFSRAVSDFQDRSTIASKSIFSADTKKTGA